MDSLLAVLAAASALSEVARAVSLQHMRVTGVKSRRSAVKTACGQAAEPSRGAGTSLEQGRIQGGGQRGHAPPPFAAGRGG